MSLKPSFLSLLSRLLPLIFPSPTSFIINMFFLKFFLWPSTLNKTLYGSWKIMKEQLISSRRCTTQHNPFWYIMSMQANQAPPNPPCNPPPPTTPALQAYWRNHQWMLSFFRQSSKDKVSSFYPLCKSILGLTGKNPHKITSNTTTYRQKIWYYGYISLKPGELKFWRKNDLKRYQLDVDVSALHPQFFLTYQPEPSLSPSHPPLSLSICFPSIPLWCLVFDCS